MTTMIVITAAAVALTIGLFMVISTDIAGATTTKSGQIVLRDWVWQQIPIIILVIMVDIIFFSSGNWGEFDLDSWKTLMKEGAAFYAAVATAIFGIKTISISSRLIEYYFRANGTIVQKLLEAQEKILCLKKFRPIVLGLVGAFVALIKTMPTVSINWAALWGTNALIIAVYALYIGAYTTKKIKQQHP